MTDQVFLSARALFQFWRFFLFVLFYIYIFFLYNYKKFYFSQNHTNRISDIKDCKKTNIKMLSVVFLFSRKFSRNSGSSLEMFNRNFKS